MKNSNCSKKTIKMKCPECLNFVNANINDNSVIYGVCNVCKTTFSSKQKSEKEKLLRIVKQ